MPWPTGTPGSTTSSSAPSRSRAEERQAFLDAACGDDDALRGLVHSLLAASEKSASFLDRPAMQVQDATASVVAPLHEGPGRIVGAYKLLQTIGEGGFGVVYMAEQESPIHRMVALKIIKPGMDTAQVIARFESERQALALMDHPNIARVLDAGATESGRPYFVMELVKGVPITEFCDRNQMPPEAGCSSSSTCAGPSSTRTRRGSSTATSSPRM